MSEHNDDWSWFDAGTGGENPSQVFDKIQLAKIAARFFQSSEGAYLLDFLRAITLERTLGPAASDALLRHQEGQRQLFVMLTKMIERGASQSD